MKTFIYALLATYIIFQYGFAGHFQPLVQNYTFDPLHDTTSDVECRDEKLNLRPSFDSCYTGVGNGARCGEVVFYDNSSALFVCNCDPLCGLYGDCCGDFHMACPMTPSDHEHVEEVSRRHGTVYLHLQTPTEDHYTECFVFVEKSKFGVWMTSGCPATWNDSYVAGKCNDSTSGLDGKYKSQF